jgi:tRNA (cmo5U34)-methyltransferase
MCARQNPSVASVGDGIRAEPAAWTFGSGVAEYFDSHVVRSVPMYAATHALICDLADEFVAVGSRVYDLGCSTGRLLDLLAEQFGSREPEIVGVDIEPEMVARARLRCSRHPNVSIIDDDIVGLPLEPADLVIAHYTLQFVARHDRPAIVGRVREALSPGGAFLVFEKIRASTEHLDAVLTARYHSWKRAQGFSDDEIDAKAVSLVGVLEPFTSEANWELLTDAGFLEVIPVFRWLNWEGLLAVR